MDSPPNGNDSSEFTKLQDRLHGIRKEARRQSQRLFLERERRGTLEARQSQLERVFDREVEDHATLRASLEDEISTADNTIEELESVRRDIEQSLQEQIKEFERFSDPRASAGHLDAIYPFLLFPVRLETRFKEVDENGATKRQLWVRVYPDDVSVDTFEPTLSDAEVEDARRFWIDRWRAGGHEDQQRAAWRALVGSHGSGRAAWILDQFEPQNPLDEPEKAESTDIVLVIPAYEPLTNQEQEACKDYWLAIRAAEGDQTIVQQAFERLTDAVGSADRAEELRSSYPPANLDESPADQNDQVVVSAAFLHLPSDPQTKHDSWSMPAQVNVMPERFVLLGYVDGQRELEELGNIIPSPLTVGVNPFRQTSEVDDNQDIEGLLGEGLRWLIDFDRAVELGMGFKIDLEGRYRSGFDRLFVLGLRLSADASSSKEMLEELIRGHHHGQSGLSLVPQGTPTNNTENRRSGFSSFDDPDLSFDYYLGQTRSYSPTASWLGKAGWTVAGRMAGRRP